MRTVYTETTLVLFDFSSDDETFRSQLFAAIDADQRLAHPATGDRDPGQVGEDGLAADAALSGPFDPADLRRCRLLLEAVPAFRAELHRMAEVSEEWAALVARWDELCATMDRETPEWRAGHGSAPETFALMQALR